MEREEEQFTNEHARKYEDSRPSNAIIRENSAACISRLYSWLRAGCFINESNDPRSTVADLYDKKPYAIPREQFGELLGHLEACRRAGKTMHFNERQYTEDLTHSGIMLDFDIYQPCEKTQMTDALLCRICGIIGEVLRTTLDMPDPCRYNIYVIGKPNVVQIGDRYKDGIHILIPQVMVSKQVKAAIFDALIRNRNFADSFTRLQLCPESAWPKVFDIGAKASPVFFFGSCKSPIKPPVPPPYVLKHISTIDIDGILSRLNVNHEEFEKNHNMCAELCLTYYDESSPHKKIAYQHAPSLDSVISTVAVADYGYALNEEEQLSALLATSVNAKALHSVLELLTEEYYTEYKKWFSVMCAIAHTSKDYYIIAKWFSKRVGASYDEDGFEKAWSYACRQNSAAPITIRSVNYWAMQCAPTRYKAVRSANYVEIAKAHVLAHDGMINHFVVAQILYQIAMHRFCTDVMVSKITNKSGYIWYEFVIDSMQCRDGGIYKWREEVYPETLHKMIPVEVDEVFGEVMRFIRDAIDGTPEESLANWYKSVIKLLKTGRNQLGNNGFQNGVVEQAKFYFRNRRFADELDARPKFLGCGNGVLEIGKTPRLYASYHEILISKFTRTRYVEFSKDNPRVRELLQAFREIYIEPDVFMFMLFYYSTALDGSRKSPIILMTVGGGQNGKTAAAYITRETLGDDYSCGLKPALLTSPNERAEAANEAVMAMKDRRFCYFDEFNEHDSLNPARMKSIANPAKQDNRGNYKSQQGMANTATIQMISNYPLSCDTQDHGTWRRIFYYNNKVKFCEHPAPDNPYEKPEKREIIHEWPESAEYRSAWLSILVYFYSRLQNQYSGDISKVPRPTIDYETEKFRNAQDMVNCFITTSLYCSPNADPVPLDTLITRYREWFSSRHRRQAPMHTTLVPLFKSSRIAKHIMFAGGAEEIVSGIRVKNSEDRLGVGETSFAVLAPPRDLPRVPDKFSFEEFQI